MNDVFSLPVRVLVQRCVYRTAQERGLEAQVQQALAQDTLMEVLKQHIGEQGSVTATDVAAIPRKNGMTVTMMAECVEEIGKEVPMSHQELQQIQLDNSLREEATND